MPSLDPLTGSRRALWLLAPLSGVFLLGLTLWPQEPARAESPSGATATTPPGAAPETEDLQDEPLDAPVPLAATRRPAPTRGTAEAWVHRGAALLEKDDLREALQDFKRAARLNPRSADAWYGVALCSHELHRDRDAMAAAKRALSHNPSHPLTNLLAGFVQQQAGHVASARRYYQRYLAIAPEGDFAGEIGSVLTGLPAGIAPAAHPLPKR